MSKHSGQHITPSCYLESFKTQKTPESVGINENFEPGIWISDKDLKDAWRQRGPGHSIFKERHFYTLKNGDLSVETKVLNGLEKKYAKAIQSYAGNKKFSEEEIGDICDFVGSMFLRTRSFQKGFQQGMNTVVGFVKDFMGDTHLFREHVKGHEDISKRLLSDNSAGEIIKNCGVHFLINKTEIPFITCDEPVIRENFYIDQIQALVGTEHAKKEFTKSDKNLFFYMALTPTVAFVSSPAIKKDYLSYPFIQVSDENIPFRFFNLLQRQAKKHLISDREFPLGSIEPAYKSDPAAWEVKEADFIEVCTAEDRLSGEIISMQKTGDTLVITAKNKSLFSLLKEKPSLKAVLIQYQGGGMQRKNGEIEIHDLSKIDDGILTLRDRLGFLYR